MISDKEARQYILQHLYDEGYRYLARDKNNVLYVYKQRPAKEQYTWSATYYIFACVQLYSFPCFKDIKWADEEPIDIVKELGIIDWTTVPKDTKVLVWDVEGAQKSKRYFSHYEASDTNFPFKVYCEGATSWTGANETIGFRYCELFNDEEGQDHD